MDLPPSSSPPKQKYQNLSEEKITKEWVTLAAWMDFSEDRFVLECLVAKFFKHYANIDLEQAQKGFDFWRLGFLELTKPTSTKAEEIEKLKNFVKNRMLSGQAETLESLNLVNCAMRMTSNCFRNRVYERFRTHANGRIGSATFAIHQALGLADALIEECVHPFLRECVAEFGGKTLEERLIEIEMKVHKKKLKLPL